MWRTLLLLLALPTSLQSFASPPTDFLPVSVWYSGGKARAPMLSAITPESAAEWRKDLEQIKTLGFNTVRTWVEWSSGEPREGQYHLEQLDLFLKLAEQVGLRVIVQTYMDSAPDWVCKKYPDGRFVAQNGEAIPSQAAPGYCFDHPGVRAAMLGFLKEVARHAAKSPAFYAWDLWSEPHIINWAEIDYIPNASFCYCDYSEERFREWLHKKYGSLAALNRAWYRQFESWKDVEPPRFDTILSYTDYIDWRIFITQKLEEDLGARADAVREIMPNCITTSHAAVPSAFGSFSEGDGNPDDYLMAKAVDYYGTSLYPKHSLPPHWAPLRVMIACDLERSAADNRGFYVGELQGGFGVRGDVVSQEITPTDLVRYMWTAVSRGAKGMNIYAYYPMSSGYESGGYGLIDLDGSITARSKAAGETAKQIDANSDLLLKARPQRAEAAIVVNQVTNLIGGAGHVYNQGAVFRSLSGYYRMFMEHHIPVDFIDATSLTLDKVSCYKLIVLPYPIMMMRKEGQVLQDYVRRGGHLFVEARAGWVDERGFAAETIPGFGWDSMLGVHEESTTPQPETRVRWGNTDISGAIFEEHLTAWDPSAKVVATFEDGSPAAYEHRYGKGDAIMVGTYLGQAYSGIESRQQSNIMLGTASSPLITSLHPLGAFLVSWADLDEPDLKTSAPLDLEELVGSSGRMIFLMNWNEQPASFDLKMPLDSEAKRVVEVTDRQEVPTFGNRLHVQGEVAAGGVRVYRVDY